MTQQGQSLVQVLVGASIMGVLMMAFASMMSAQQKELKAVAEKLGSLELGNFLTAVLSDGGICTSMLTDTTVNSSAPYTINTAALSNYSITLPFIKAGTQTLIEAGKTASALSSSLRVKNGGITLNGFSTAGGATKFLANLQVDFDPASAQRPVKPFIMRLILTTDVSNKIIGCQTGGAVGPRAVSFTTPGTQSWTVPPGVTHAKVTVVGGGGAGGTGTSGSSVNETGQGGGGGGTAIKYLSGLVAGTVFSVEVGAGGTGGSTPADGNPSSFGTIVSASGGGRGANNALLVSGTVNGHGGTGSGGDINMGGQNGSTYSGAGGSSHLGGGGSQMWLEPGTPGKQCGGGGGGGPIKSGGGFTWPTAGEYGGNGGDGCVIVEY